jgi:hypothetical protein
MADLRGSFEACYCSPGGLDGGNCNSEQTKSNPPLINRNSPLAHFSDPDFIPPMQIKKFAAAVFFLAFVAMTGPAFSVVAFTETFNTGNSNWTNGQTDGSTGGPVTWNESGGVGNSGYISYNSGDFTTGNGTTYPGFDPVVTQLMFRANATNDASGDAFVGNWLGSGVVSLSLMVRHNYTETLNFYSRLTPGGGAGASLAPVFAVAPNVWTEVSIPIIDSNPPFLSYGGGSPNANFNGVFSSMQNMTFGFYLPPQTDFTNFTMDIDNVTLTVPEPSTAFLIALGFGGLSALRRRRKI